MKVSLPAWIRIARVAALAAMVAGVAFARPARIVVERGVAFSGIGASGPPAALEASLPDHGRDLVSIVAADIDADGDLDIIASDASLHLFVWVNDGAGHLTPQRPAKSTAWHSEPGDPAFDGGPATSEVSAQSDPPSLHLRARTAGAALALLAGDSLTSGAPVLITAASIRTPRAPPAAFP